jgi:hypothetical protein
METPPFGTSVLEKILRTAFRLSFSIYKATSAYNERLNGSSRIPIPYGKIVILTLLVSALASAVLGPLYGFLVLISSYPIFVLFNFGVAWLLLDASSTARLYVARRYIKHCLLYQMKPNIPFVVYLRPFAVDSSLRLHRHRIAWNEKGIRGLGYTDDRRPLLLSKHDDLVDYARIRTERMGVLIQAGIVDSIGWHFIVIKLLDGKWQEQIYRLCEASQLILFLPLFGIDLRTNIEFNDPTPPEIVAILNKRDHDGLETEIALLDDPNIAAKTIFIVPGLLSDQERDAVRRKLSDHGFVWGQDSPYISEYHIRLYRCRTKGEVMRAVEIGHYSRVSLYEDAPLGELGPNVFYPVSRKVGNSWVSADGNSIEYWLNGTHTIEYALEGNAIEYLLEDDPAELDRRWPRRLYPRQRY